VGQRRCERGGAEKYHRKIVKAKRFTLTERLDANWAMRDGKRKDPP
jgi:hypothetical protein